MILVSGIRIPLQETEESAALDAALGKLGLAQSALKEGRLYRMSLDARRGAMIRVCSVVLELTDSTCEAALCQNHADARPFSAPVLEPAIGTQALRIRPVIAGFGPAGLFAAYLLAQHGYRPLVLERGSDIDSRVSRVAAFFVSGQLDTETNVQFGEGGAGTFSDGKLTTRINDPLCAFVLDTFVRHGAPGDILYKAKPHIGTDRLRAVIRHMRAGIIAQGGEVRFDTRLDDIQTNSGSVRAALCGDTALETEVLILACGHSARDTFSMLRGKGLTVRTKPFSVGLRIEHLQQDIDRALYGKMAGHPLLPPGEYALSAKVGGRGVYTFCMCPGGTVVAAASEEGGVVTNGMSDYARGGVNANSAIAVSVNAGDFADPFAAVAFQRGLEQAAFAAGGGSYRAPAQDVGSFLEERPGWRQGKVVPSYPRGVTGQDLSALLGRDIAACLHGGIAAFGKKLKGFDDAGAVLTGIETRTSSPLRIGRDGDTHEADGLAGLYPCGEGAGYAGGIMSAAVDGLKTALAVMARYAPQ